MNSNIDKLKIILLISLITILTRALPFIIFGGKKKLPQLADFLKDYLPNSIMVILVLFCLRDIRYAGASIVFSTLIAALAVVICQYKTKKLFLSILIGTGIYMLMIRLNIF